MEKGKTIFLNKCNLYDELKFSFFIPSHTLSVKKIDDIAYNLVFMKAKFEFTHILSPWFNKKTLNYNN